MLFKKLNDGHYESHKVKTKRVVLVTKPLEMTIAKVIKMCLRFCQRQWSFAWQEYFA